MRAGRLVLCCLAFVMLAVKAAAVQYAFEVSFKDKQGGTATLNAPLAYLSQRALDRRNTQGIAVDSTDLPVSPVYVDSVLNLTGGILHITSRWLNLCVILVADSSQILNLQNRSFITNVRWVAYYATELHNKPGRGSGDTISQPKTTGSSAYYGDTYVQTRLVNGDCLHDLGYKGEGKLIAVLDAGFTDVDTHTGFDSLRQSGRLLDTHNFTLSSGNVFAYDTHGTSALSTMAGNMPGTYIGSAPYAQYALYITEDDNSEQPIEMDNMLAGTERADSIGADVISESLGYNTFDNPAMNLVFATDLDGKTTVAAKAANMATKKGILFVASAGNEGGNSWNNILTPGDADSALTIGSVDVNKTPASNSGYGPNAAGQVKPDITAMGVSAYVFSFASNIITDNGTSFSTPQAAGWATCLWQAAGNVKPYQLRQAIRKSADHFTNPGNQVGYGVPDFCTALQYLDVKGPQVKTTEWATTGPNPFNDQFIVNIGLDAAQNVNFSLMDIGGRLILTTHKYLSGGINNLPFTLSPGLPAGLYFLKISGATRQEIVKLQKL